MTESNKIFIRIDLNTVNQLKELASPEQISPDLVTKVIIHCHTCDKWWAGQKKI